MAQLSTLGAMGVHITFGDGSKTSRLRLVAVLLTLSPWILFLSTFTLLQIFDSHWAIYCEVAFFIACFVCSPLSLVLLLISFREVTGGAKTFWILLAIIPILFALFILILGLLNGGRWG